MLEHTPIPLLSNLRLRGLKSLGFACVAGSGLHIRGKKNVALGNFVKIARNVDLDAGSFGQGQITIGDRTVILDFCILHCYGGHIFVGTDCSLNPFCVIYGHGGLTIGNRVRIAAHTVIIPANHTFDDPNIPIMDQPEERKGIVIEDDVWIGAGVRILDGVTIGKGSVIGAGTVVTKNIPPMSIAVGVPAAVVRNRNEMIKDSEWNPRYKISPHT